MGGQTCKCGQDGHTEVMEKQWGLVNKMLGGGVDLADLFSFCLLLVAIFIPQTGNRLGVKPTECHHVPSEKFGRDFS